MGLDADTARKCFEENFRLFGDDAEKHNLYNGLFWLAKEMDNINSYIRDLDSKLNNIDSAVRTLQR